MAYKPVGADENGKFPPRVETALKNTFAGMSPQVPQVPAAAVSLESPYDIAGTGVHPDVVYVPAGWGTDSNGKAWKYWMAYTPYWRAKAEFENPSIQVSNDGLTWVTPAGLVNPVDPDPTGTAINSDPDMLLVAGTMYLYYRQHDPGTNTEQIMLRTSTNGITWSAETTVIDTTPLAPANRLQIISPALVHVGGQFIMYSSKDGALQRRTSADGVTWAAPTNCTLTGGIPNVSHVDAIYSDGRYHLLLQDGGSVATEQNTKGGRKLWLAKSSNGTAFTTGTDALLKSEHMAQRMIYRTCGLHEIRNGKDFYRLWVSGVSYSVGASSADLANEAAGQGFMESYYIGYTQGYDPADSAAQDKTSLYPAGDVVAGGAVRGDEVGGNRGLFRFLVAAKGWFDRIRAVELRAQTALFEGPPWEVDGNASEWATRYGYGSTDSKKLPPVIVSSDPRRTYIKGSSAAIDFINKASDNTKANSNNRWRVEERQDGKFNLRWYNAATDSWTNVFVLDNGGNLVVSGAASSLTANGILQGSFIISSGDRVRVGTAKTPANSNDNYGGVGDIMRDDNYIYVKTTTGWKRSALTAW